MTKEIMEKRPDKFAVQLSARDVFIDGRPIAEMDDQEAIKMAAAVAMSGAFKFAKILEDLRHKIHTDELDIEAVIELANLHLPYIAFLAFLATEREEPIEMEF